MIQAGKTLAASKCQLPMPLPFYSPASTGARVVSVPCIGRACGPLVTKPGLVLSGQSKGTNTRKQKFRLNGRPVLLALGDYSLPFPPLDAAGRKRKASVLQIRGTTNVAAHRIRT